MISICRSSILIWQLKFLTVVFLLLAALPAQAQEPLFFQPLSGHARESAVTRYLGFGGGMPPASALRIADADLNGDGIMESLILFPDDRLRILAFTPRRPVTLLGTLEKATGLQILDQTDYGVRRLSFSGTPNNDFAKGTYAWNPWRQRYEKSD